METQDILTLASLSAIWGASFLFIKVGVGQLPPVWVTFGRSVFGGVVILALVGAARIPTTALRTHWRQGLVVAAFNAALPYTMFAVGETIIDSSLAGILNATLPLWTALMAPLWADADSIHPRQAVGLVLGFGGAVLAAGPGSSTFRGNLVGAALCLVATLSYAFSTHFSRRAFRDVPSPVTSLMQCAGAALLTLPLALVFRPAHGPSLAAVGAVAGLGIGGTGIAMALAYRLIQRVGATRTTIVTYLLPPWAVFWGFVVLHEAPTPLVLGGMALILVGVFFVTSSPKTALQLPEAPPAADVGRG